MIRFKFKLNDNTIEATVPEGWHEVKLKHVIALDEKWTGESKDMIGLLSAFTGEDYRNLANAKGNNLWEPLFSVLSYVFDAPNWKKFKLPKQVHLNGKTIKPPKKLELETFGQKILAMQLLAKENHIENLPELIAIYLQPSYDGVFEGDRVPDIKKHVLNMHAYEAMPYGLFFLNKLLRSKNFGKLGLRVSLKTMMKLKHLKARAAMN